MLGKYSADKNCFEAVGFLVNKKWWKRSFIWSPPRPPSAAAVVVHLKSIVVWEKPLVVWLICGRRPAGPAQPSHFLLSSGDLFSLPMIFFCFVLIFFPLGLWRPRTAVGALASVYTRDPLGVAVQSSINRAFWLLDWRFSHTHTSLYLPVSLCCLHSIRRGPKQLILDLFTRVRPSPGSALPNN